MSSRRGGRPPPAFPRSTLSGPSLVAARALLGARLVREPSAGDGADPDERRVGRIVEVEAYIGEDDRASHARMGPTARNRVMFGPPGVAYVYLVYGMHHCLNVVTEPATRPAALLIRAVEPLEGVHAMRAARSVVAARRGRPDRPVPEHRLAAGPGLVGLSFGLDRGMTGIDLCDPASPIRLESRPAGEPEPSVTATPRLGIAYAGEPWVSRPWRLVVADSRALSGPRAANPSREG